MQEPETRYTRGKEGHVAYQVVGDGPFDVVFIPNWLTCEDAMWEEPTLARFLRRLGAFSRLLCFDKRGTGVSDPVSLAALPTLEQWNDDVRAVMDAVGSQRAALVGVAEGGPMAMLFAATYPERTSFDGPARAVRCACAVARAVRRLGIDVRAGLHTGEVEYVGDNVAGIAVHTAARVAALAEPGEVFVSSTVRDLVAGSGLRFADRGVHTLRGIPDEWRLCAVER